MEWWQTLLIALCPSILSTVVAIVVPIVQITSAQKERKDNYESDKKLHVSQMRLDMEFEIYKEVSEKVMELVSQAVILFDDIDLDAVRKQKDKKGFHEIYNDVSKLLNIANLSINKHAIFIPDEWYQKFLKIKVLCLKQLQDFDKYVLQDKWNGKTSKDIKNQSDSRVTEIGSLFRELVKGLRKYLSEFGSQEKQ